jgi:hypothetical protein
MECHRFSIGRAKTFNSYLLKAGIHLSITKGNFVRVADLGSWLSELPVPALRAERSERPKPDIQHPRNQADQVPRSGLWWTSQHFWTPDDRNADEVLIRRTCTNDRSSDAAIPANVDKTA